MKVSSTVTLIYRAFNEIEVPICTTVLLSRSGGVVAADCPGVVAVTVMVILAQPDQGAHAEDLLALAWMC